MKRYSVKFFSFVLIVSSGLINLIIFTSLTWDFLKKNIYTQYEEHSRQIISSELQTIKERTARAEAVLNLMSRSACLSDHLSDKEDLLALISSHVDLLPNSKSLIFASDQGFLIDAKDRLFPESYDPRKRNWYMEAMETDSVVWIEPFLSYIDQDLVFAATKSVKDKNGKRIGVLGILMDEHFINTDVETELFNRDNFLLLLSPNGTVVSSTNEALVGMDFFQGYSDLINIGSSISDFQFKTGESEVYFISAAQVPDSGLFLVSALNQDEIQGQFSKQFIKIFIIEVLFILFLIFLTYFLSQRYLILFERLAGLMTEAEKGNYKVKADYYQFKEVAILSEKFNSMVEGIKNRDTVLQQRRERIKKLAYNDLLTGLPNRASLIKNINEEFKMLKTGDRERNPHSGALLFLDLDGFKSINDTMGHSTGDQVLQEIAMRLSSSVEQGHLVCRIGGDEFVILLKNIDSYDIIADQATKLLEIVNQPIFIENNQYEVGASIGVSVYPLHGETAEQLLKKADIAMYKVKHGGKNDYQIFKEELEVEIMRRNMLESGISRSLRHDLFYLVFQPLYSFTSGELCGFEALLRTREESLDTFAIDTIITSAEETGIIYELEKKVFEKGFEFITAFNTALNKNLSLSVNISPRHLIRNDFTDNLLNALERSGADPAWINLEVTETAMMESMSFSVKKLELLKEEGLSIHLDDFGTGYSSLSYLQELPLSTVKIDRAFVESIESDRKKRNIVELIIKIAHNLDLAVVAEGIETDRQYQLLKDFSCDVGQGYYMSSPLEEDAVYKLMENTFSLLDEI